LDSAIHKSIIYANFASGTPPHPECNMIHFWIDESVAHFQIPKLWRSVSKFTKLWGCRKKNVGAQEETAKERMHGLKATLGPWKEKITNKRLLLPAPLRFSSCTLKM